MTKPWRLPRNRLRAIYRSNMIPGREVAHQGSSSKRADGIIAGARPGDIWQLVSSFRRDCTVSIPNRHLSGPCKRALLPYLSSLLLLVIWHYLCPLSVLLYNKPGNGNRQERRRWARANSLSSSARGPHASTGFPLHPGSLPGCASLPLLVRFSERALPSRFWHIAGN